MLMNRRLVAVIEQAQALRRACRSTRQRAQELQGVTLALRHHAFLIRSEAQSACRQALQARHDLGERRKAGAMAFACPGRV